MLDIYSKQHFDISPLSDTYGLEILKKAFKSAAISRTSEETHSRYLKTSKPEYENVLRICSLDALECWYGFIFTKNESPYKLNETLSLQLEGLELVCSDGQVSTSEESKSKIELEVQPNDDHMIILRRT